MADKRSDGRLPNQLRPLSAEQKLLERADGSARFACMGSEVLVAVYGPVEAKRAEEEDVERAVVAVDVRPASEAAGEHEAVLETQLKGLLEPLIMTALHPRAVVRVVAQVLREDGSLLSTLLNAAVLAVMDAGLAMTGMGMAVTAAITPSGLLLLDPTAEEEGSAAAVVVAAFHSRKKKLLNCFMLGELTVEQQFAALDAAQLAADSVLAFMRLSVKGRVASDFHLPSASPAAATAPAVTAMDVE
eukprot:PLAT14659.1.p2 GENE.PLAT14659.1~~PLAT14659.1.p2  ORF type:complete len:245 (+),score=103.06 PLAT14659.1:871-1605(+)